MINNNLVIIFVLAFFLTLQNIPTLKAQQDDVYSGLGAIPSAQTWYICSKQETNYINYKMKVVETDQTPTQNFGINVQGNHPLQYPGILGLLTYATNFTGIQLFIDPQAKFSIYWSDLSCFDFPALECNRVKDPPFEAKTIICLGISNPQNTEQKFTLSISFVYGVLPLPLPTVSPKQTNTTSSIPSTNQRSEDAGAE
ncbi:22605_t:CDS:2, partial [Rhizophagus irregularis]